MRERRRIRHRGAVEDSRAVLYCRVSSERQKESGLGIDEQRERLESWARASGVTDYVVIADEAESGRSTDRPGYTEAMRLLASGERDLLVVAKLDRLARSVKEVIALRDRMSAEHWNVVVLDGTVKLDTRSANGKLVLNILSAVAEWEADMAAERTREAYTSKRRAGSEGVIGADVEARILRMVESGLGLKPTADALNADGVPTAKGGRWYASTVRRVVEREETRRNA